MGTCSVSKLTEEMNTFMKMVSGSDQAIVAVDNITEKRSTASISDILQAHPKEVAVFKRSPEDFDLSDHSKFYEDLFDYYSNSGDMPYGTMKARDGDPYEWIQDKLMDEILGSDDNEPEIGKDNSHDDFDAYGEYNDDNDWGGFDNFESKLMKDLPEEELTEWVWVLPALATAVRVGGPALLKLLKHGAKKAAPVAANTGTAIIKNPGTTLSWAAGGYVFKSVYDVVEKVKDVVGDLMDDTSVESFAEIVWKYKLPVAAVVAVLYGGKKLKDYMAGEEDKGNTTINNYYGSDQQPATENQDRMRHLAGIKTTPTLAVIKNTH